MLILFLETNILLGLLSFAVLVFNVIEKGGVLTRRESFKADTALLWVFMLLFNLLAGVFEALLRFLILLLLFKCNFEVLIRLFEVFSNSFYFLDAIEWFFSNGD